MKIRSTIFIIFFSIFSFQGLGNDKTIKTYINGAGEFLYGLAWPTATYSQTQFKGIFKEGHEHIARITLHGKSGWNDGHLWVNVDVVFRNNALHDIRWGDHNALLMPPGKTVEAMAEVINNMAEEYERQNSSNTTWSSNSGYAITAIYNETDYKIQFKYLWSSQKWETGTLQPGQYFWFWYPYPTERQVSPDLQIAYDWTINDDVYIGKTYNLERNKSAQKDVAYAKKYKFLKDGIYIKVYQK